MFVAVVVVVDDVDVIIVAISLSWSLVRQGQQANSSQDYRGECTKPEATSYRPLTDAETTIRLPTHVVCVPGTSRLPTLSQPVLWWYAPEAATKHDLTVDQIVCVREHCITSICLQPVIWRYTHRTGIEYYLKSWTSRMYAWN